MQEITPVFKSIIRLLEEAGVEYELFEHEPVWTSEEAAKIRQTGFSEGAKALVFKADQEAILIVVPGDRRVDTAVFKQDYSIKDLSLMDPDEVFERTGLEVGGIPPWGELMGLPTYVDEDVFGGDDIVFNAGSHTRSVKMKARDFRRLNRLIVGSFSREPE